VLSSSLVFVVSCLISCFNTFPSLQNGSLVDSNFLSLYAVKDEVVVHLSLRSLDFIHIREFRNIMKLL
jgi:hypothetical protein